MNRILILLPKKFGVTLNFPLPLWFMGRKTSKAIQFLEYQFCLFFHICWAVRVKAYFNTFTSEKFFKLEICSIFIFFNPLNICQTPEESALKFS